MAMSTMLRFPFVSSSTAVFKHCRNGRIFPSITQQAAKFSFTGKGKKLVNFRKTDGIPDNFDLVYRNPAARYLHIAQAFSLVSGIAYTTALLYIAYTGPTILEGGYGPSSMTQLVMASISLIGTCILLQIVCYKSPIRIYSDTKKFILVAQGPLGQLTPRKIEFNAGTSVKVLPKMVTVFRDSTYKINGKNYIIFEDHFKSNADYNRMIGL